MSNPLTPPPGISAVGRGIRWALRILSVATELGLLVTGFSVITSDADTGSGLAAMSSWDALALAYLLLGVIGVLLEARRGSSGQQVGREDVDDAAMSHAQRHPLARRILALYWGLLPVVFSLLGLTAALSVVFLKSSDDGFVADATKGAGAVAMVAAWLLLHVSYARRYEWFYRRDGGGLEFPGKNSRLNDVDFLYFAMTLGSSFATSDVNITTTRMRWHVLVHSVLSFFYNAVVLAVAFRILTGG